MPTLITQDEFEPEFLLNPNLAMAIPAFAALPVAQIRKKKFFKQLTTRNGVAPESHESHYTQGFSIGEQWVTLSKLGSRVVTLQNHIDSRGDDGIVISVKNIK
jgi:hypothetical protein